MSVDAIDVLHKLNSCVEELERLSGTLDGIEDELESVQLEYEEYVGRFEEGLWEKCNAPGGPRWPGEVLRERMARRQMDPEFLGRYVGLTNRRRRIEKRISVLKSAVEGRRSTLSAMKEGLVS